MKSTFRREKIEPHFEILFLSFKFFFPKPFLQRHWADVFLCCSQFRTKKNKHLKKQTQNTNMTVFKE